MEFLTSAQIRALASFNPGKVDYAVIDKVFGEPGWVAITFWLHGGSYLSVNVSPEGEVK